MARVLVVASLKEISGTLVSLRVVSAIVLLSTFTGTVFCSRDMVSMSGFAQLPLVLSGRCMSCLVSSRSSRVWVCHVLAEGHVLKDMC